MAQENSFQADQYVEWDWGNGTAEGQIAERFERDVTRHGSADNPAYLIRQDDGDEVLKLGSEIRAQG